MKSLIAVTLSMIGLAAPALAWEARTTPAVDQPIYETPGSTVTVGTLPAGKPVTLTICMMDGAWCLAGDGVIDATKLLVEGGKTVAESYKGFSTGTMTAKASDGRENGFATFANLLEKGESARLLIWSDSTGNIRDQKDRWPARFAAYLGSRYKTHSIDVVLWNPTIERYDPPMRISNGTTSAKATIYVFAVSGSVPQLGMAALYPRAIEVDPDGLILNHGINFFPGWDADVMKGSMVRGAYTAAIEQFRASYPGVPVSIVLQNPNRDDDHLFHLQDRVRATADAEGVSVIDVYDGFADRNKNPSLYFDAIHPGPEGNAIYEKAMEAHFEAAIGMQPVERSRPFDFGNIAQNADFKDWTDKTKPDGWNIVGTVKASLDGSDLLIEGGGKQSFLEQPVDPVRLGNLVPSAQLCIQKKTTGKSKSEGLFMLAVTYYSGTKYYYSPYYADHQDAFGWWCLSGIDGKNVKAATIRLYPENSDSQNGRAWFRAVSLRNVPILSPYNGSPTDAAKLPVATK